MSSGGEFKVTADVAGVQRGMAKVRRELDETVKKAKEANKAALASQGGGGGGINTGKIIGGVAIGATVAAVVSKMMQQLQQGWQDAIRQSMADMRLKLQLDKNGLNGFRGEIDEFVGIMEDATGVADDRIQDMVTKQLASGEKNIKNALSKIQLALDIESTTGQSADSVLDALTKAGADNEMMLKRLASSMGISVDEFSTLNEVVAKLWETTSGATAAMAEARGGFGQLMVALDNLFEKISKKIDKETSEATGTAAQVVKGMVAEDPAMRRDALIPDISIDDESGRLDIATAGVKARRRANELVDSINKQRIAGTLGKADADARRNAVVGALNSSNYSALYNFSKNGLEDIKAEAPPTVEGGDQQMESSSKPEKKKRQFGNHDATKIILTAPANVGVSVTKQP